LRIDGAIVPLKLPRLAHRNQAALYSVLTEEQKIQFEKNKELIFLWRKELVRFRANIFMHAARSLRIPLHSVKS